MLLGTWWISPWPPKCTCSRGQWWEKGPGCKHPHPPKGPLVFLQLGMWALSGSLINSAGITLVNVELHIIVTAWPVEFRSQAMSPLLKQLPTLVVDLPSSRLGPGIGQGLDSSPDRASEDWWARSCCCPTLSLLELWRPYLQDQYAVWWPWALMFPGPQSAKTSRECHC